VDGYDATNLAEIEGLVVCADRDAYVRNDTLTIGASAITTNDALPFVSLSSRAMDKRAFGVVSLSTNYDPTGSDPTDEQLARAAEGGDVRAEINAIGEGAMWVCDAGGALESGDYITTSSVPGYGMCQADDCLRHYTVAKATMSCDFTAPAVGKVAPRKDAFGNNLLGPDGKPVYDPVMITSRRVEPMEPGGTATVETLTEPVQETEPAYRIRHIMPDGAQVPQGTPGAIRSAFIGVTYHCG
jgi:hypothetical protein